MPTLSLLNRYTLAILLCMGLSAPLHAQAPPSSPAPYHRTELMLGYNYSLVGRGARYELGNPFGGFALRHTLEVRYHLHPSLYLTGEMTLVDERYRTRSNPADPLGSTAAVLGNNAIFTLGLGKSYTYRRLTSYGSAGGGFRIITLSGIGTDIYNYTGPQSISSRGGGGSTLPILQAKAGASFSLTQRLFIYGQVSLVQDLASQPQSRIWTENTTGTYDLPQRLGRLGIYGQVGLGFRLGRGR